MGNGVQNWLSGAIATTGQVLGLPEMGISERLQNTGVQTQPWTQSGNGGYVNSPVPGGTTIYPVSGGVYQSGPLQGKPAPSVSTTASGGQGQVQGQTTSNAPSNTNTGSSNSGGGFIPVGTHRAGGVTGNEYWTGNGWTPDYSNFSPNSQYGQQLQSDVDNAYGEASGVYNNMYNDAVANKQNFLDQYTQPYEAQKPTLTQGYNQGLALNQNQQNTTKLNEQNAIADARRLFNELSTGVNQRFGGTNSAGEFANAFYGREFQRNMGNIQNTTGQNIQNLLTQQQGITDKYQAQLQQIEAQKAAALSQAQNLFQQRLDQINSAKGELAQNKAALKLQALQELRQRAYTLQDNFTNFAHTLSLQHAAANDQLRNQIAEYSAYAGKPIDLAGYQKYVAPIINAGQSYNPVSPTGYLGYNNGQKYDEYGNPLQ